MQVMLTVQELDTVCSFLPSWESHNSVLKWLWDFLLLLVSCLVFCSGVFGGLRCLGLGFLVAFHCFK